MLTKEQIEARKKSIGASDSAAIVGLNRWRSAFDVWAEKTGRVESFAGNEATRAGDLLEQAVIEWALDTIKAPTHARTPAQIVRGVMSAHLDCAAVLTTGEPVIIEAKTSGVTGPLDHGAWGEEGSDEVPDAYKVQCQHQLYVAGEEYQRAYLAALIPPRGFVLFVLNRDEDAIGAIRESCESFWENHVKADVAPEGYPSLDTIKRMTRRALSEVSVSAELVEAWEAAKAKAKAADEEAEAAKVKVLAALGDAERGVYLGGEVTYLEQRRKAYQVAESTFRVLRHKRAKG